MIAWRYSHKRRDGVYVGNIAEMMVSRMLHGAEHMPWRNLGYDYLYENQRIDVKASVIRRGGWTFLIKRNKTADKFICIGLDDSKFLKPVHMWEIPGKLINKHTSIRITPTANDLLKWQEFEIATDRLLSHKESHKMFVEYIR